MTRVSDQDDGAILLGVARYFKMDLGYQWAGGVDHAQAALAGPLPFTGCDTMRTENDPLTVGNVVQAFDENRALGFERLEHEAVVDDLMADVKRRTISLQRVAHRFHRPFNAGAETARLRQHYPFNRRFV